MCVHTHARGDSRLSPARLLFETGGAEYGLKLITF